MTQGGRRSDPGIVAVKPANNAERSAAEPVEPRTGTKGNADQQSTRQAQDWERVSQALARIRQAAKLRKKERFTSLLHHVSAWLVILPSAVLFVILVCTEKLNPRVVMVKSCAVERHS